MPNGDFELGPDSSSGAWLYGIDSVGCTAVGTVLGPDFWTVVSPSPDRLIEGDIPCNWDKDTAQSGKAYVDFAYTESGKTTLISPLQKDSLYQLSVYLSLQTFKGTYTQPHRVVFIFNNGGDSIIAPYVNMPPHWQHLDTTFKASANSTEITINGFALVSSGTNVDNIFLQKISGTGINYFDINTNITLFPNPANDFIIVSVKGTIIFSIFLFNHIGEKIIVPIFELSENNFRIDLSGLSNGIYAANIYFMNGFYTTKKFIKLK
ncbi:MAG: T9SS type A sorting domain-containing protein [Bacteroidetes bacterium]|nr:T9SS type A sorting domain-containing protein [Bacteroidota bacterium]